jgi:molybdopterin molybdotransferase
MHFITYEESLKNLKTSFTKTKMDERVFIDQALGRILSEDIVADHNSPAYPTSAMDGYAIKFEDQRLGRIKIVGDLPAGTYRDEELMGGYGVKTFTGSLMIKGSDTLIPIENVEVEGDEIVIKEEVPEGFSVRPVGENYKEGEVLIERGSKIDFAEIGVLASLNIAQVSVYKKPSLAVIATGSEILDVGERQSNPSQIYSSNQFTLEALAKRAGANVTRTPLAKDDKESLQSVIHDALEDHDILVTTGGVSVGDYDFVKDILKGLDAEYITEGVILKPGQHIKIVKTANKYIVALPGFPYSSTVTFILYVIPLIKMFMGLNPTLPYVKAVLKEGYKKRSKKTEFAACNLYYENGTYTVDFSGKKSGSSAILTNMLGDTGLLEVPRESGDLEAGSLVDVINLKAL